MASPNNKIIKYKHPFRMNIGFLIFLILFIYMCFSITSYMSRHKVRYYEVVSGGIVDDTEHTGMALREEKVQNAPSSGYVNYYIREGKRCAVGTKVYSLDETGNLTKFLEENSLSGAVLSDENLSSLKKQLSSFSMGYSDQEFSRVYDNRYMLDSSLNEYTNLNAMENLDQVMKKNGINYTQVTSPLPGVISYNIDSYESKTADQISMSDLNKTDYKPVYIKSGELAEAGKPVYKVVTSEQWSLVFALSDSDKTRYANKTSLNVTFKGYDLSMAGNFSMITGADGNAYGVLTFDRFMVKFIGDRYLTFNIQSDSESGLKIPKSAVTSKTFFTVPVNYLARGGNDVDSGFYKEVYQDGKSSVQYIPAEIYYQTDDFYYLDASDAGKWKSGDYIVKPDSQERFQIGPTAELQGVYNINKGYAVFKQIDVIAENDEYDTIRKNTKYGLNVYDHILLIGSDAQEGDPIYQ